MIYVFESNFEIFQTLSSNSFDINPLIIFQNSIFEKVQILSCKFKYPFESIQTSDQKFEIQTSRLTPSSSPPDLTPPLQS
jgi:hypothetical protein